MHTEREFMASRPDTIITNKKERTCRCGTICGQYHTKGSGKETKIQDLMYGDKKRACNMKCVFIPVIIIGVTGMVEKGLKTICLHSLDTLQKTAVLTTSHIIRKVLQSEI
jgi:hypothetical protein